MDQVSKIRHKWFIYYLTWNYFITLQLVGLSKVFEKTPQDIQWLLGIALPLIKEINDRCIQKIIKKASTEINLINALFVGKVTVNLQFSFWLAIFLATVATHITGYVLLTMNFVINLQLCYKAIKLDRKVFSSYIDGKARKSSKRDAIMELVLNETVETMVHIAFIVTYIFVYHGPNPDVIGNVGCECWTFKKVENLTTFLSPILLMAFADCVSGIISGVLLWKYCNVNIILEYCATLKKYWVILGFLGASNLLTVKS